MITRLNHLALKATDPAGAASYAADKLGFDHVHTDEQGRTYVKPKGGIDPYSIVYVPADGNGLDHASYLVKDAVALDQAAGVLESKGIAVTRLDGSGEWNHEPAIRFRSPSGHAIELTTGIHTEVPVAHGVSSNGASGPQPVTTDHVGLAAADFDAEMQFATDVLGLLPSNRVLAPGDVQVMSFLRAPKRFLYHCLVVVRGEEPGVHHYQMSLKNPDTFYATYDALKAAGVDVGWGPLRHGPGHNIAMYFQDGAGYWVEYSVEEEIILDDEHYEPRTWTVADPHVVDEWQTGAPPLGLMGPPPMPPDTPEQAEIRKSVFARVGQMVNKRLYVGMSKVNMTSPPPPIDVIGEHLKYALDLEQRGILFAAGPFVDDEGKMVGDGMFIVRANSKAEAAEILAEDPIHVGNFRTCTVHGWTLHEGKINLSYNLSDKSYSLE
jgi:catechol 2,3-dioxygenase